MAEVQSSLEEPAYSNLYKYSGKTQENSHQQRVDRFLIHLKEKRHKETDKNRDFSEVFFGESLSENDVEPMEYDAESNYKQKKIKFELMKSELLREIPDDLSENWFVKFCPDGFRMLIVAKSHSTECYTKSGRFMFLLKTNFPGGGKSNSNGLTVLDCVYNKTSKSMFIMDCLCWNSMSMLDSEATFRFFWLKTKFNECPELEKSNRNINFYLMEYFPVQLPLIQDQMSDFIKIGENYDVPYDGVAFYHKEGHYTCGVTPLVGWLPSYMLPEQLNIDVDPKHMGKKPENYVCVADFVEDLNCKKKPRYKRRSNQNEMDVEAFKE